MKLLEFKQIPMLIIVLLIGLLVVITIVMSYQCIKFNGLEGIRKDVYQLILTAEHVYKLSGQGRQRLKWVVQKAHKLLPRWLHIFITETTLEKVIDVWFLGIKDLLDDGKVNQSQKQEEGNE